MFERHHSHAPGPSVTNETLRVAVVGTGAVGSTLAAVLARGGHEVSVADAEPSILQTIEARGIQVSGALEATIPVHRVFDRLDVLSAGPYDLVVLALKAPVLARLATAIARQTPAGATFLVAANGLEIERDLVAAAGAARVHRMVLHFAARQEAPGHVHLASIMNDTRLGPWDPGALTAAASLARRFTDAGLVTRPTSELEREVWEKTILNASLNALCSVMGLTMSAVLSHDDGLAIARQITVEAVEVAAAHGVVFSASFVDDALAYVGRAGDHVPSMRTDLEHHREVEIEYLNGAIVRAGEAVGVATPYNAMLTGLVRLARDRG